MFMLKIRDKVCRLLVGVIISFAWYWVKSARACSLIESCEEGPSGIGGNTCKVRMQTRSVMREEGECWMDEVVVTA